MDQKKDDLWPNWNDKFNFATAICAMHRCAITVPFRRGYGTQALGFPCLFALGLMALCYVATADPGMLAYMGFWLLCLVARRIEAVKIAGQVHSRYDGMPVNLGSDEKKAKMYYEPILMGILGSIFYGIYTVNGLSPAGLPCFLLAGVITLPFIEIVKKTLWERRIQGMRDAQLDQEMLMDDFKKQEIGDE